MGKRKGIESGGGQGSLLELGAGQGGSKRMGFESLKITGLSCAGLVGAGLGDVGLWGVQGARASGVQGTELV